MRTFFKVILCGVLGAALAVLLMWVACLVYDQLVPDTRGNEIRAWQQFVLLVVSSWIGFIGGAIGGMILARRSRRAVRGKAGPV